MAEQTRTERVRNREAINRFVDGETDTKLDGHGAVTAKGGKLLSYNATIAYWLNGELVVNAGWDGYSPTTSKHMKYLYDAVTGHTDEYAYRHDGYDSQTGYEGEHGEQTVVPLRVSYEGRNRSIKPRWKRLSEVSDQ